MCKALRNMNIHIINRFNTPAHYGYAVYLAQGQQDMLGVLSMSASQNASTDYNLSLALIDVQKQVCESLVTYSDKDFGMRVMTDALLRYDVAKNCWIIAQLQDDDALTFRTVTVRDDGSLRLSPLCLLEKDESNRGFNPLLGLEMSDGVYRFLYHKAVFEHKSAPLVTKLDVALQRPAWDALEGHIVSLKSGIGGTHIAPGQEQRLDDQGMQEGILLPEHVFFDPGTIHASQTAALTILDKMDLAEAEMALVFSNHPARLLVLCSPESWVTPQMGRLSSTQPTEEQWRIWFTGWDSNWTILNWTYSPELGLPIDSSIPTWEYPRWPTVQVAVIAGPSLSPQSLGTFVAVLAMLNQEEVLSHGVCFDENGQVVQICASPLGLRPSLCCCKHMVIGVDLFEGHWRLWNWAVFQHREVSTRIALELGCQRACVYAEPASAHFWLIEELQDGVRVTHRDVYTLTEIASAAYLPGVGLLPDQEGTRALDGYHDVGVVPYQETLLLLARSADGELVLYQVQ
jgi:hypothetical protein